MSVATSMPAIGGSGHAGSSDSLVLSSSPAGSSKESRFNRLISKLNSRPSSGNLLEDAQMQSTSTPSTPVRYNPGMVSRQPSVSPAFSDSDDAFRPPVFESRFMRELEANHAPAIAQTEQYANGQLSPRPPFVASHSSPAAPFRPVSSASSSSARSVSPSTSSPSTSTGGSSLKNRLQRVASSSSLFGSSSTSPNSAQSSQNRVSPTADTSPHHRKTASLLTGGTTPSPRARGLSASNILANHRRGQSELVSTAPLSTTSEYEEDGARVNNAGSPRFRSNHVHALSQKDGNIRTHAEHARMEGKDKDSFVGIIRKRSIDGLNAVMRRQPSTDNLLQPDHADNDHHEIVALQRRSDTRISNNIATTSTTTIDENRPTLGARLTSAERISTDSTLSSSTTQSMTGPLSAGAYNHTMNGKSTPGFPRQGLGISSGLSESSKRFRSAFRMNKARAEPGSAGAALRKPGRALRSTAALVDEQEGGDENQLSHEGQSQSTESDRTPDDFHGSMRSTSTSLSSINGISPPPQASSAGSALPPISDRDWAEERAQLVPTTSLEQRAPLIASQRHHHQPAATAAPVRARRAPISSSSPEMSSSSAPDERHSPQSDNDSPRLPSPEPGLSYEQRREAESYRQTAADTASAGGSSYLRSSRTVSRSRADDDIGDRLSAASLPNSSLPSSDSNGSLTEKAGDSDTLLAREELQRHADRRVPSRMQRHDKASEDDQEVIVDSNDKENSHAPYQRNGRKSPPALRTTRISSDENPRPVLGEVRRPLQSQSSRENLLSLPIQSTDRSQPSNGRLAKISSSSSSGYAPLDRQVVLNDYVVPLKRGGDTPPQPNYFPQQQHYPEQPHQQAGQPNHSQQYLSQRVAHQHQQYNEYNRPPPPTTSLPPVPPHQVPLPAIEAPPAAPAPATRKTVGTVTVKGKVYTRMGLLGRGGSSKVFRVCDKDHQVYALKKVDLGKGADSETYQSFLNEIDLLERLRGHDRIIQLYAAEVNEAKRSLIMVLEIGEIDLNQLLQERQGKRVSMNFIRHTWEQMLEAVNVIHEVGIVHTDLKPANFVLVKGALKLIDFGIAKAIPSDTTNIARDQQIGTANYMSPEALNPHISNGPRGERVMKLGRPSDVWSLGCILYQIVYGHTPFGRIKNLAAKMNAIQTPGYQIDFSPSAVPTTNKGEPLPDLAVRVEEDLLKCMKQCLRYEPKKRATIPELLEDPFLRMEPPASASTEHDAGPAVGLDPHLMMDIVHKTMMWSQGRQPSRSEQERFVESLLRQVHAAVRER